MRPIPERHCRVHPSLPPSLARPRWVDIHPEATIGVYDCTQACEHLEGTLEHVLAGAPYGGADALWNFVLGEDGRATSVEEIYTP
ncbi:MAG TPA: hypothetical protein DCS55_19930 [Acidimicrobiaceae bacterium]|nr:hypothetical protein [Acidimicrobiaceae bacterium]